MTTPLIRRYLSSRYLTDKSKPGYIDRPDPLATINQGVQLPGDAPSGLAAPKLRGGFPSGVTTPKPAAPVQDFGTPYQPATGGSDLFNPPDNFLGEPQGVDIPQAPAWQAPAENAGQRWQAQADPSQMRQNSPQRRFFNLTGRIDARATQSPRNGPGLALSRERGIEDTTTAAASPWRKQFQQRMTQVDPTIRNIPGLRPTSSGTLPWSPY